MVLSSAVLWGCGDGDSLPKKGLVVPAPDAGVVEEPDAEIAEVRPDASTELAPVEANFAGQAQAATSKSYSMISRLAAPIGGGVSGEGTSYVMTTGVLALQGQNDEK